MDFQGISVLIAAVTSSFIALYNTYRIHAVHKIVNSASTEQNEEIRRLNILITNLEKRLSER